MTKKSPPNKPSETAAPQPPAWRTWATVALLLHLTCLGIAVASNAGQASPFRQALRNVPLATEYLQALSMDRAYDFPLAGALPQDGYHRLVLTEDKVGKLSSELPNALPSDGMWLGVRRRRYEHLAFWVAQFNEMFEENLDLKTQLPHAVARRWLAERGTPTGDYKLLCQRILPKRWAKATASEPATDSSRTGLPSAEKPNSGVKKTLALRLLWEEQPQDLLVSLVEDSSQLAAVVEETVVEEDEAKPAPQASDAAANTDEAASAEEDIDDPAKRGEPE